MSLCILIVMLYLVLVNLCYRSSSWVLNSGMLSLAVKKNRSSELIRAIMNARKRRTAGLLSFALYL